MRSPMRSVDPQTLTSFCDSGFQREPNFYQAHMSRGAMFHRGGGQMGPLGTPKPKDSIS